MPKLLSQIHEKNVKEKYWKYVSKCILIRKDALSIEKYAYRIR